MKNLLRNLLVRHPYTALGALKTRRITIDYDRIPHTFENVPLKKILNWIAVEASIYVKPTRAWGWPTHLQIEPSSRCNLKCVFCPVTLGMDRPDSTDDMNLDQFERLIDEVSDYVFLLTLWDWGEPLMNPHLFEMISYARGRGIRSILSTNGHLFNERRTEQLFESGLDTLIIAVDGTTQATYEKFRQGGKLDAVMKGVKTVVERKRALGAKKPFINLRMVVMRQNEHEVPAMKELAKTLGVDALTFKTLNPYDSSCASELDAADNSEFMPRDPHYRRFDWTDDDRRTRVKRNGCKSLWNNPSIHANGVVSSCFNDPDERHRLGKLSEGSFRETWQGEAIQQMRRRFREDWESIELCRECSYAYKGGTCGADTIAEAIFY